LGLVALVARCEPAPVLCVVHAYPMYASVMRVLLSLGPTKPVPTPRCVLGIWPGTNVLAVCYSKQQLLALMAVGS
jgi:hypothetical protein